MSSSIQSASIAAPTVDDLEAHASMLAAIASAILLGLAHGKYDGQSAITAKLLSELGVVFPPASDVEKTLAMFLFLSKLVDPAASVPRKSGSGPRTDSIRQANGGARALPAKPDREHREGFAPVEVVLKNIKTPMIIGISCEMMSKDWQSEAANNL